MSFLGRLFGGLRSVENQSVEYKSIKIGTQTWMTENLAYKANSGCWAYDNDMATVRKYGYLYNWQTAKKVCPSGWHLPTDAEWTTLINYLGGESDAGGKLKSATGWDGTNESGFTALPAGCFVGGKFVFLGNTANFWTATEELAPVAWLRFLAKGSSEVRRQSTSKTDGLSIRCIKDN